MEGGVGCKYFRFSKSKRNKNPDSYVHSHNVIRPDNIKNKSKLYCTVYCDQNVCSRTGHIINSVSVNSGALTTHNAIDHL